MNLVFTFRFFLSKIIEIIIDLHFVPTTSSGMLEKLILNLSVAICIQRHYSDFLRDMFRGRLASNQVVGSKGRHKIK